MHLQRNETYELNVLHKFLRLTQLGFGRLAQRVQQRVQLNVEEKNLFVRNKTYFIIINAVFCLKMSLPILAAKTGPPTHTI